MFHTFSDVIARMIADAVFALAGLGGPAQEERTRPPRR